MEKVGRKFESGGGTKELKRNQRKRLKMGIVKSLERMRRFRVKFKELEEERNTFTMI